MHAFALQAEVDDELEVVSADAQEVNKVHKLILMGGEEEGNADNEDSCAPTNEKKHTTFRQATIKSLKEIVLMLNLPMTGKKEVLFYTFATLHT